MTSESEPRKVNPNPENAKPVSSGQVLLEIEDRYTQAGRDSLDVEALIDYTNQCEARRAWNTYHKKVENNPEEENLSLDEKLTDRIVGLAQQSVLKGEEYVDGEKNPKYKPGYKSKFLEANSLAGKLKGAYIAEGATTSSSDLELELEYKVIDQLIDIRNRLITPTTQPPSEK